MVISMLIIDDSALAIFVVILLVLGNLLRFVFTASLLFAI